jgi:hypothetical protein
VRSHPGGFTDAIPYPVFRKSALLQVGGYNEELARNQDNDMNQRLREQGHKLYLTGKTQATYYARPDVQNLWAYGYRSGKWNAITLRINSRCMRLRHFVPFAFVASLLVLAVGAAFLGLLGLPSTFALVAVAAVITIHLVFGLTAGIRTSIKERSASALLLPAVILGFHLSYGMGTLAGLISRAQQPLSAARPASSAAVSAK